MGSKICMGNGQVAPAMIVEKQVPMPLSLQLAIDINGNLIRGNSELIDFTGIKNIKTSYLLNEVYKNNQNIVGNIDLSSLEYVDGSYAMGSIFNSCTGITSVDLSGLLAIEGSYALSSAFYNCTNLTYANLSELRSMCYNDACCLSMFSGCSKLETADLHNLSSISRSQLYNMFQNCRSLKNIDLSNLVNINGDYNFYYAFDGCSELETLSFDNLVSIRGGYNFQCCFRNCTKLKSLYFYALDPNGISSTYNFSNMLFGCSNVIVHFPSNLESVIGNWSDVLNGFGGTNTNVLFDLPVKSVIDLSNFTKAAQRMYQRAYQGCTNITSVDMHNIKSLKNVDWACEQMFENCTNLTTVDLSGLEEWLGTSVCSSMFKGCTSLTNVDLSNLKSIGYNSGSFFYGCTSLTSFTFDNLEFLGWCGDMFHGCNSLTTVRFPKLKQTSSSRQLFSYCPALTDVYFNSFDGTKGDSYQFENMLQNSSNVTLHFPSNSKNKIQNFRQYPNFGGTNITVLFDLPATE